MMQAGERQNNTSRDQRAPPMLVLHLNSNTDDQVLLQAAAKQAGVPIEWHVVDCVERAISYLRSLLSASKMCAVRWVELVLLDLPHHDDTTLPLLRFIRETPKLRNIPVVVYTGVMNPNTLQAARNLGVDDLHDKPAKFEEVVKLARHLYEKWGAKADDH